MNSGISDSDSGQNTKMAGLSQNQCPVYRGMTVRVMPESVSGLLRNMHSFSVVLVKARKPCATSNLSKPMRFKAALAVWLLRIFILLGKTELLQNEDSDT